jgi:putative phosphoribosyl transferase
MAAHDRSRGATLNPIRIPIGGQWLCGDLGMLPEPKGLVLFAHGSGSGRHSPRNRFVARVLEQAGLATLLVDLLTDEEERVDRHTSEFRFDIEMLAGRLVRIVDALNHGELTASLPIGLFGASTGGGAALVAAADRPRDVAAVVSRGGRPDLAGKALPRVVAPTLLIVGGLDRDVLKMNRDAMAQMRSEVVLEIVPGATHLFEEPGKLEQVATMAAGWFRRHFAVHSDHSFGGRAVDERDLAGRR